MTAIKPGAQEVISLPPYSTISITATGSGTIERLGNVAGDQQSFSVIQIAANTTIGPFGVQTRHLLHCVQPSISYDIAAADFPAVTSDVERIIKLSQAEYDALSPADPVTLYLIVG